VQSPQSNPLIKPPDSERVMASLAHLSILLPQFGLVAPLILWLVNRESAPFAAYQAKQAFWFHLFVTVGFWAVCYAGILLGIFTLGLGFLALLPLLGAWHIAAAVYGIIGAVHAFEGRDFRYAVIGNMVQPD